MDDPQLFRPVARQTTTTRVMEQIYGLLQEGRLPPGQRLPGERHLAQQLGVSRNVVREALHSLASMGFLAIRQGHGTVVASGFQGLGSLDLWKPWLRLNCQAVMDLLAVREPLELMATRLAAERATPERLRELESIVVQLEAAGVRRDVDELERLDADFHARLAGLSGNPFLASLNRWLTGAMGADRRAVFSIPNRAAQSVSEHRRIIECLKRGDAAAAVTAMEEHVQSARVAIQGVADPSPALRVPTPNGKS